MPVGEALGRATAAVRERSIPATAHLVFALRNTDSPIKPLRLGLRVSSVEESLQHIVDGGLSVARFGDGELRLARGYSIGFQPASAELAAALTRVARTRSAGIAICVPGVFGSLDALTPEAASIWKRHLVRGRRSWVRMFDGTTTYENAFISRPYIDWVDKEQAGARLSSWKEIWRGRDILIVEGKDTRMGIGNDLIADARTVRRVIAPAVDAWSRRHAILREIKRADADCLVLLALGPTATVLAADLSSMGRQAIDVGHLDIEYEWFRAEAQVKSPIAGKYVNEAGGPPRRRLESGEYRRQIIADVSD